jgi:hypothetical protein
VSAAKPILGDASGRPVHVDVQRLITTRLLVQSNSGGGKSWAVRRLLEQTHGHAQQIVLDSEGEFFTLRERHDFVLAGRGGDCQAHPKSAATLARKLLELCVSAVIDLSELPHQDSMRHIDRVTFVANFCRGMLDAPRELWHPTLVVLDEAHRFCPEGEPSASAAAVADLASAGRKRAFAVVLATQRISKLSKSAAAECNNRLVGRTGLDVDQRRASDELGFTTREARLSLRSMTPGTFHVFGPAFDVTGVELVRIGEVKTTHPEPGGKPPPVAPPRGKVVHLLAKLAAVPEQAEEESRTIEATQAELRKAKGELAALKRAAPAIDPDAIERAREEGRAEVRKILAENAAKLERWFGRVAQDSQALVEQIKTRPEMALGAAKNGAHHAPAPPIRVAPPRRVREVAAAAADAGAIERPMQRVLDAMAWLEVAGVAGPYSRDQVAALAEYAPTSGGYRNILGKLSSAGLVTYPATGMLDLTVAGRTAAESPSEPTTPEEIQRRVLERIDAPMRRCLEPVLAAYPKPIGRDEIASAAGYEPTSGGFRNLLGRLSTLGAVTYPRPGDVVAAPWLFLEGAAR